MSNLANHDPCGKTDTEQAENPLCIVIGCQRLRGATWLDALTIARNGMGYVRLSATTLALIWSDAYEQTVMQ